MKIIVIASTNDAKVAAFKTAFGKMFPGETFDFQSVKANSGVPDQPRGREQTLEGAKNRVIHAQQIQPNADFWATNESGVEDIGNDLFIVNWVVISNGTTTSNTLTASFQLPPQVAVMVRDGMEVTQGFYAVYGEIATKNGVGGIGNLSHGHVPRAQLIEMAAITALIPFANTDLYDVGMGTSAAA